jgi:cell wall-associated NlpC family hydrolase
MKGLTSNELRLVEEYVWVLDFVSRCALGVDRADRFYLYDKASELQRAAGQLVGLHRVRGQLRPGDLLIYASSGPSRRHVAMVVGRGRMVEALGRGVPVRSTSLRSGWLGAVRPGGGP